MLSSGTGAQKSVFSQTLQEILIMLEFENHCCGLTDWFTSKSTLSTKTLIRHLQRNRLSCLPCSSKCRILHCNRQNKQSNKQAQINKCKDSKMCLWKAIDVYWLGNVFTVWDLWWNWGFFFCDLTLWFKLFDIYSS